MAVDSVSPDYFTVSDEVTIQATFRNRSDNALKDLTGATINLIYWPDGGSATSVAGSIVGDATDGVAKYFFSTGLPAALADTAMYWQWKITDAASNVFFSDEVFRKFVRAAPI